MAINQLKLVGKNSGEIFMLRYPNSLLDFCGFDFSSFAKSAVDLCNEALKAGSPDYDRISDLRKEIQSAHCYIENNIRTYYDKIVFDCWIDYVCRRDNISESGMWNRLVRCKTPFDKAIFARLCEFRYNRASNEWLNLIRVQDYAKSKLEFIFSRTLDSVEEAAARRNYFDMMFSVTAHEMGCRIEDLGVTKVFSIGRVPPAPFMFPNVSKEIVRHVLTNFDYSDDYSDIGDYSESADQIAMDAYSKMKAGLPKDLAGYNISGGISDKNNGKIYMPCSLKAAIDLEIDAIIDDGAWLARCKRCKRFFLRSHEHPEEYCSRSIPGERTCLEIFEEEHPRPTITPELEKRCQEVKDEVYSRVDKTMSVREYDSWHLYLEAMIAKVKKGEISPSELDSFLDYSLEVDISKSRPIVEVPKREPEPSHERVVKPFVPERISRSEISAPAPEPVFEERPTAQPPKEGFFTSPSVQRQKNERPQISHIIRNGESLGDNGYRKPDPAGFREFGAPPVQPPYPSREIRAADLPQFSDQPIQNTMQNKDSAMRNDNVPAGEPRRVSAYEKLNLLEERLEEENRIRREQAEQRMYSSGQKTGSEFRPFAEPQSPPISQKNSENTMNKQSREPIYDISENDRDDRYSKRESIYDAPRADREELNSRRAEPIHDAPKADREEPNSRRAEPFRNTQENDREGPSSSFEQPENTREKTAPRVIKKNAAAISAYGKAAGTAFTTADPMEKKIPDSEPFKNIGSIFDVLEQSENSASASSGRYYDREPRYDDGSSRESESRDYGYSYSEPEERVYNPRDFSGSTTAPARTSSERVVREPYFEPEPVEERKYPDRVTADNAPSGFWTEERNLFPHNEPVENIDDDDSDNNGSPASAPVQKRHKSNKTKRLLDVIMSEPDSNPNFRNK